MITANEKELLTEYFDKYKSFFVTEYDAAEKKFYLRIWLEEDGIWFQQDFFSLPYCISFENIEIVTTIQNRLAIKIFYPPFKKRTIHIEGFEEPLCDIPDKEWTAKDYHEIEKLIKGKKDSNLIWDIFGDKAARKVYRIYDLFRVGKIDFTTLYFLNYNQEWFDKLHTGDFKEQTKTLYSVFDANSKETKWGLWDYKTQSSLKEINF